MEKHIAKHTSIAAVNVKSNEKSAVKSNDFDENSKMEVKHNSITTINVKKSEKREERSHSEEGFFRRFINRSGRKTKKEREAAIATGNDTVDTIAYSYVKMSEPSVPAIKKSTELSIMDVLSKVREREMANDMPNSVDPKTALNTYLTETIEQSEQKAKKLHVKSSAVDKPRSGPAARQRILPKDISSSSSTSSSPSADLINAEMASNLKQTSGDAPSLKSSPPRHDFATSFLRFSPPKSSTISISPDQAYNRASQYRSEEILNTINVNYDATPTEEMETASTIIASTPPKAMWPLEMKFMQNAANRASTGWSQCQQKISKMANAVDHSLTQQTLKSPAKGKIVEKSKSFRLYSKNYNDVTPSSHTTKHVSNMPSLPDLTSNNVRHSRHTTTNRETIQSLHFLSSRGGATSKWTPTRSSSSSRVSEHALGNSNKFEINDFRLVPSKQAVAGGAKSTQTLASITSDDISELELDRSINTTDSGSQSILVTSTCKTPIHQNIDEIEDNIDKIMKSSFVTVLKKSPTADLYQIKSNCTNVAGNVMSATNNNNISLTTITKDDDPPMIKSTLNFASVENPPLVRHSMTATKLEIPVVPMSRTVVTDKVPEFMQIQLNRIDGTRPKSFIEYSSVSTGTPTHNDDDKERRFSNESIEISDKKKVAIVASPTNIFGSNQHLNKSTESLKIGMNRSSAVASTTTTVSSQQMSRGSSITDVNKSTTPIHIDTHSSNDCLDADTSGSDDGSPFGSSVIVTRRKSVSDKKLKFEKKIEEIQAEVKRSSIIGIDKSAASISRKSSIDDDTNTVVVMRQKKSLTSKSSEDSDDPTPELIKVFARRSLKIKDSDDYIVQKMITADSANNNNTNGNQKKGTGTPDSDKENQVCGGSGDTVSDEKTASMLNVVPKMDIHIRSSPISVDYDIREKSEVFKKDQKIDGDRRSSHSTNKTQSVTGTRFGGNTAIASNNYRNTSAFFENRNSVNLIIDCENAKNLTNNNNILNASKTTKVSSSMASAGAGGASSAVARHTIAGSVVDDNVKAIVTGPVINGNDSNRSESEIEFKGILERRAEWEKRANQAFK